MQGQPRMMLQQLQSRMGQMATASGVVNQPQSQQQQSQQLPTSVVQGGSAVQPPPPPPYPGPPPPYPGNGAALGPQQTQQPLSVEQQVCNLCFLLMCKFHLLLCVFFCVLIEFDLK